MVSRFGGSGRGGRDEALGQDCDRRIQAAIDAAGQMALPTPASQFEDVFATSNWMLDEQKERILDELDEGDA